MKTVLTRLDSCQAGFAQTLRQLLAFEATEDAAIDHSVVQILAAVKTRGDAAVLEYTQRFDRLAVADMQALEIPLVELQAALAGLPLARREALETAAARVRAYHEVQKRECGSAGFSYTEADGTTLGQKVTADRKSVV